MSIFMSESDKKTTRKHKSNLPEEFLRNGGPGRPKGVPNKCNIQIIDRILGALDTLDQESLEKHGKSYLVMVGQTDPKAFVGILGRVVPKNINLTGDVKMTWGQLLTGKRGTVVAPAEPDSDDSEAS